MSAKAYSYLYSYLTFPLSILKLQKCNRHAVLTLKPTKASTLATLRNAPKTQRPVYWLQLHATKQTPIVSIL